MKTHKITCISASNNAPARGRSVSTLVCDLFASQIAAFATLSTTVRVLPLLDYELKPCRMCGKCYQKNSCAEDSAFNTIFEEMCQSDAFFFVVPHYATLPAKLIILFEKLEEMLYLHWTHDPSYCLPFNGKPAGLVVHGGMEDSRKVNAYYQRALLEPLKNMVESCGLQVIDPGKGQPRGVIFGIKKIHLPANEEIMVRIDHDWEMIASRTQPLAENMAFILGSREGPG